MPWIAKDKYILDFMFPEAKVANGPERPATEAARNVPPPAIIVQPPIEETNATEEDLYGDDDTAVEDPPGPPNFI